MNKNRLLLGVCLVVILIVAGTTSASALWKSVVSATSTVSAANLEDSCTNVTSVQNASFELPVIANYAGSPSINQTPEAQVPGWVSNPEHIIEIWNQNNYLGIAPPVGNQFVELNASVAGTLSQTIPTTGGQVLQWSLLHRGRGGVDVMQVLIGAAGGTQVSQGNISDGPGAWVRYSGTYTVPSGQNSTSLSFKAVSTGSGDNSIGNFLDDVSFGSGPCIEVSSTVTKVLPTGVTDTVIRAGDTVEYLSTVKNSGSSPSFQTALTNTIPSNLDYVAGSVRIGATAAAAQAATSLTDIVDTDVGKVISKAITVNLGTSATPTVGGSIAQGNQVVVRFLAKAQATTVSGTTIDYTPSVTYVNMLAPQWTRTATADNSPITVLNGADLQLTATSPASVNVTSNATYTFTVKNLGPQTATATRVTFTVPPAYMASQISGTGFACVNGSAANTQVCTFTADLNSNASRDMSFTRASAQGTASGVALAISGTASSAVADPVSNNNTASTSTTTTDTQAPTAPGQPVADTTTNRTANSITLTTNTAATDNIAVTGYNIYRGGVLVGNVPATATTFTDTGLLPSTSYSYTFAAFDAAGNVGPQSTARTRSTLTTTAAIGTYQVMAANGLCVAYTGNGTTTANLVQNTCASVAGQRWKFATSANETVYNSIMPSNSTTLGWESTASGFFNPTYRGTLATYGGNDNEDWQAIQDDDALTYHFVTKSATGRCLTAPNNTVGTQLTSTNCTGAANQSFTVTVN